jgi:hypothetical protein
MESGIGDAALQSAARNPNLQLQTVKTFTCFKARGFREKQLGYRENIENII